MPAISALIEGGCNLRDSKEWTINAQTRGILTGKGGQANGEHREEKKTKLNRKLLKCFWRDLSACIWRRSSAERTEGLRNLI